MGILFSTLLGFLAFALVLGTVVMIHELGHFIMARRAGILCHEFSIGMGPALYKKKIGETVYAIRAIPLGGYVMMAGEEVNDDFVKHGSTVQVVKDDEGLITHIILNEADTRYENAESVEVNFVDLKGKDGTKLMINYDEVRRDAHYVFKDKEIQIAPYDRSFESKTIKERFFAIFAGPFMNFVLAFVLFVLMAFIVGFPKTDTTELGAVSEQMPAGSVLEVGDVILEVDGVSVVSWYDFTDAMRERRGMREIPMVIDRDGQTLNVTLTPRVLIQSIGIVSHPDTVDVVRIGAVQDGTLAQQFGFEGNDIIVSVDNQSVDSWETLINIMLANTTGERMDFVVEREGVEVSINEVWPYDHELLLALGASGVVESQIGVQTTTEFRFFASFSSGFAGLYESGTIIFRTLGLLATHDRVGIGDLAGPIGIYSLTSSAASQGLVSLMSWTALLSVNLGVINLLPIPALDGGRLVILGYEGVTRKKLPKRVENTMHLVAFMLLMGLFVYVAFNDILRLFNIR